MKKAVAAILALVLTVVILAVVVFLPFGIGHSFEDLLPKATGVAWFLWQWGTGAFLITVYTACYTLYNAVYRGICDWYKVT